MGGKGDGGKGRMYSGAEPRDRERPRRPRPGVRMISVRPDVAKGTCAPTPAIPTRAIYLSCSRLERARCSGASRRRNGHERADPCDTRRSNLRSCSRLEMARCLGSSRRRNWHARADPCDTRRGSLLSCSGLWRSRCFGFARGPLRGPRTRWSNVPEQCTVVRARSFCFFHELDKLAGRFGHLITSQTVQSVR